MGVSVGGNVGECLMVVGVCNYGDICVIVSDWFGCVEISDVCIDDWFSIFLGGM